MEHAEVEQTHYEKAVRSLKRRADRDPDSLLSHAIIEIRDGYGEVWQLATRIGPDQIEITNAENWDVTLHIDVLSNADLDNWSRRWLEGGERSKALTWLRESAR